MSEHVCWMCEPPDGYCPACRDEDVAAGVAVGFAIVALGTWAGEAWRERSRRIFPFNVEKGNWYCIGCGARQDYDPVNRDDNWHCDGCPHATTVADKEHR